MSRLHAFIRLLPLILLATACTTVIQRPAGPPATPAPPVARAPAPAEPAPAPGQPSEQGNPPFYEVYGERYHVMPDSGGYREQGVASWYGREFHGKKTSSGAVYDMNALTAAHKTLPLPSVVRVTDLQNGRSVVVTVNDRGPFSRGRIIDLSWAAASRLDMIDAGTARVEVEALAGHTGSGPLLPPGAAADAAIPAAIPDRHLFMQVGAFGARVNAERLQARLMTEGVSGVVIRYDASRQPALYRVRIGPLDGAAEYDALASRMRALQITGLQVVSEPAVPSARPGS